MLTHFHDLETTRDVYIDLCKIGRICRVGRVFEVKLNVNVVRSDSHHFLLSTPWCNVGCKHTIYQKYTSCQSKTLKRRTRPVFMFYHPHLHKPDMAATGQQWCDYMITTNLSHNKSFHWNLYSHVCNQQNPSIGSYNGSTPNSRHRSLYLCQLLSLRWRHNDHAGVSNHQPHGCLLNRLFRCKSKKTSKLRVTGLCAGKFTGDRWISRTNGQLRGKCFHLMTSSWWTHQLETFPTFLVLCEGNPPATGGFPSKGPVTGSFDVFVDLRLNKRLSKQSRRRWFDTSSCSLWHHCIVTHTCITSLDELNDSIQ